MGFGIKIDISGPRACFTRPEMKAERVSYDIITPSAARGLLEAVYWKPAIAWRIDKITVLNEIKFSTFRRNELGDKLAYRDAKRVADGKSELLYADSTKDRQQRQTLYLRDVRYIVEAHFEMTSKAGAGDTPEKHYNIALRRLRRGQCFNQPYLGCREFAVEDIRLVEEGALPESFYRGREIDLGFMLYDIDFEHGMTPQFFRAVMKDGIVDVARAREGVVS